MEAAAGVEYVGNGTEPTVFQLKEDGDFRSHECIELLKQAGPCGYKSTVFIVQGVYRATGRIRQKICRYWEQKCDNLQRDISLNQEAEVRNYGSGIPKLLNL